MALIGVVLALVWASLVLLAMAGIGQALGQVLLRRDLPWGAATAWGFAITAVIGGVANLLGVISPEAVSGYVIAGVVGFGWILSQPAMRKRAAPFWNALRDDRVLAALTCVCVLVVAVRVLSTIHVHSFALSPEHRGASFNIHDDFHAYLVFPNKMLESGSLGTDPFSERRMLTSLGGSYVWDALLRAQLPEDNLHMMEGGLGLIVFLLAASDVLIALAVSPRLRVAVLLLLLMVLHVNMNITSYQLPAGMMLALLWYFLELREVVLWRAALGIAILLAGIVSAKTTLVVPAGMMLLVLCVFPAGRGSGTRRIGLLALASAMTLVLLAPWMVSMYQSFGTPLYPLLGTGGYWRIGGATSHDAWIAHAELWAIPAALLSLYVILATVAKGVPKRLSAAMTAMMLAWLAGSIVVGQTAGIADAARLSFPFAFAGMAFALSAYMCVLENHWMPRIGRRSACLAAIGIFVAFAALHARGAWTLYGQVAPEDLRAAFSNEGRIAPRDRERMRAIQTGAPAGAAILARVSLPFLMDFKRNPIYIVDWPGGYYLSSPRDEALLAGPESLREYLLAHGIHYVAYSYANEASFPRAHFENRLADPNPLVQHSARATLTFQANLEALRQEYRAAFDDGQMALVDLDVPKAAATGARGIQ